MRRLARLCCAALAVAAAGVLVTPAAAHAERTDKVTPAAYTPVDPCRVFDSRDGRRPRADAVLTLKVAGRCDVPASATAIAATVTAVTPDAAGYVTVWPGGEQPNTSTLNYASGEIRANATVVALSAGSVNVFTTAAADIVFDVTGYWEPENAQVAAGRFTAVEPTRLADTREHDRRSGHVLVVDTGAAGATAAAVNITLVAPRNPTYLTVHATGTKLPLASVVNTDAPGQIRAAAAIVPLDPSGRFSVAQPLGRDGHVVVDLVGTFTGDDAERSTDGLFIAAHNGWARMLDTRNARQRGPGCLGAGDSVPVHGRAASWAATVVGNLTIVNSFETDGYLTTAAWGRQDKVATSAVNAARHEHAVANLAIIDLDDAGVFGVRSSHGADVVFDIAGWFMGPPAKFGERPDFSCSAKPPPDDPWAAGVAADCLSAPLANFVRDAGWVWKQFDSHYAGTAVPGGTLNLNRIIDHYNADDRCAIVTHEAVHAIDMTVGGFGPGFEDNPYVSDGYKYSGTIDPVFVECVAEAGVFLARGQGSYAYNDECGVDPAPQHLEWARDLFRRAKL